MSGVHAAMTVACPHVLVNPAADGAGHRLCGKRGSVCGVVRDKVHLAINLDERGLHPGSGDVSL